jgi:hypothetical protein
VDETVQPGVTHISFGPGPTEEIPADWAEKGLTWLKASRPQVWMDMLQFVMGIEKKPRGRG